MKIEEYFNEGTPFLSMEQEPRNGEVSGCDCHISNTDRVTFCNKCTPEMYGVLSNYEPKE